MKLERFLDILACPGCHRPLRRDGDSLRCDPCGASFPIVEGVPILLPLGTSFDAVRRGLESDQGRRMQAEYHALREPKRPQSIADRLRAFLEKLKTPVHFAPEEGINAMCYSAGEATRILSVGGGPTRNNDKEINLNIGLFPNVDAVGDAHNIPFLTGSVDGVWINAVLEHVEDFLQVTREIDRVVRPGGFVFVYQPFLQSYHAYPTDYWRFTKDAVEKIFPNFRRIDSGAGVGPTFALLKLMEMYLRTYLPVFLGTNNPKILRIPTTLFILCFFWLKHLDRFLRKAESSHQLASVVYFLGKKPD